MGFGPHGGYQEYVPVAYQRLITVTGNFSPSLAPLTDVPLFPFVGREFSYFGSFWGNYNDLTEVVALAEAGQIKDSVTQVRFDDVNDHIDALGRGAFVGRAVIVYD